MRIRYIHGANHPSGNDAAVIVLFGCDRNRTSPVTRIALSGCGTRGYCLEPGYGNCEYTLQEMALEFAEQISLDEQENLSSSSCVRLFWRYGAMPQDGRLLPIARRFVQSVCLIKRQETRVREVY